MQKRHFERMAEIIKSILEGNWTDELPAWAGPITYVRHVETYPRVRAILTAEVFILLASECNPRFDQTRFLQACGLVEKPSKIRRTA